jgi:hypothetical protein
MRGSQLEDLLLQGPGGGWCWSGGVVSCSTRAHSKVGKFEPWCAILRRTDPGLKAKLEREAGTFVLCLGLDQRADCILCSQTEEENRLVH